MVKNLSRNSSNTSHYRHLRHDRALALYGQAQSATTSQYRMLAVMVAFTTTGLFLLSQANQ